MATEGAPLTVVNNLARLPAANRLGLGLGFAALAALVVASWLWSHTPEWRVLYSNLSDRDGGAIVAQLSQMNMPYKVADGGGAIMVPAAQVHDTRLRLAAQGLPKGSVIGFELMENQKFGATQFQEQVNFQRGLEGELVRTIQAIGAVQGARVHLAIPKQSAFLRERAKPSASVMVQLHPGRALERAQVSGIVHLVASSVPDLPVKNITVVDHTGTLLSTPGDANPGLDAGQLAYLAELESGYVKRIQEILEPIVGRGNVRAQVSVDADFSQSESTAETFKPNQQAKDAAVRSQTTSQSNESSGVRGPGGVPGAASNQPGAAPSAAAQAAAPATAQTSGKRDATTHYEVDKSVRVVRNASGTVKRLSAAVVVNHRKTVSDGKVSYAPLKEEDIQQITALVREAIGLQKDRGDTLNVANAVFNVEEQEPPPEVSFWKQPDTIAMAFDIAKQAGAALLVLALAFGMLRPLLKLLATPPPAPPDVGGREALPGRGDRLENARAIARQDPQIVANVVKSWVSKEG